MGIFFQSLHMRNKKKLRITQKNFLLANRRASRAEEIEAHGKQIQFRSVLQKSRKVYDRNRLKRAVIKGDDSSYYKLQVLSSVSVQTCGI